MAERLSVAEDRLARVMREDVMKSLAAAKLQLAQADFDILELQVPSCEREKHHISSSHLGLIRCPTPLGVGVIKYAQTICDIFGNPM